MIKIIDEVILSYHVSFSDPLPIIRVNEVRMKNNYPALTKITSTSIMDKDDRAF